MGKLVVLKLDGDVEQGFRVRLEIGPEGDRPDTEITGCLPPATDAIAYYSEWLTTYRSLGVSARAIVPKKATLDGSIEKRRIQCCHQANQLRSHLNTWLKSASFLSIREKWLEKLNPSDILRVIISTENPHIRKLPWHLWDLLERYENAEIALSAPVYERLTQAKTPTYREAVKILAILGNSEGINLDRDRQILENLPDSATTFLVEPSRQQLYDRLWEHPWDILFFAGHSKSQQERSRIYINQTDSLTIDEVRFALRKAIKSGLKLGIFNSCDGLGLARELENLQIPQTIVMRERVPDEVAQAFLTYFLTGFARGKPFYLAVRSARERLQGLEDKYPCASWLPVICQNPAVLPLSWLDLGRRPTDRCPYRGLFAFTEKDAPFFFGRQAFVNLLFETVQKQSFVAIIGASGSGKSSAIFAGLIPRLRHSESDSLLESNPRWQVVCCCLGDRPLHALAIALLPLLSPEPGPTDAIADTQKLAAAFRENDRALSQAVSALLEQHSNTRLLFVVDRFEELYTLCRDETDRRCFLQQFLTAIDRTPNLTVVIALRADFMGQALSNRRLADALQSGSTILGPMNREELSEAIALPPAQLGVTLESGLTERILDDISSASAQLPLLEFALTQLWSKLNDCQLTHQAYQEIGGITAALSSYADRVYDNLNAQEKERARRVFVQLVRPGEGTEDTRRRATRQEVGEQNWDVVTQLANARLVVSSRDRASGTETVELVHESAIAGWSRLREWIDADRSFRTWQERLRSTMRQWEVSRRDEGALLRGALLAEAREWLARRSHEITPDETTFIQASLEYQAIEQQRWHELREASQQPRIQSEIREIQALCADSKKLFASDREFEALLESLKAAKRLQHIGGVDANTRLEVLATLQQAVYGVREYNRLSGHRDLITSVTFSPNGTLMATASRDKTVILWTSDGCPIVTLRGHADKVNSVSFSPTDDLMATASEDATIALWTTDGSLLNTLKGHQDSVMSVCFSPDGQLIASVSWDTTVKLWKPDGTLVNTFAATEEDCSLPKPLSWHSFALTSVSFSPDGQLIACASRDGTVKIWHLDGTLLITLSGHSDYVSSVVFSPNGELLATASKDMTVKLWRLEAAGTLRLRSGYTLSAALLRTIEGHSDVVMGLSFSPNGELIATASWDRTVKLWKTDGTLVTTLLLRDLLNSVCFSPNGEFVATAGSRKAVKLWKISGILPKTLETEREVWDVSFSPTGDRIAVVGWDLELWNSDGTFEKTLTCRNLVKSVSFNPEGDLMVTACLNAVNLWTSDGTFVRTLVADRDGVAIARFSPDGNRIAAAINRHITLWTSDGTFLADSIGHDTTILDISFSPNGDRIASGSEDATVQLWTSDGTLITTLSGHQKAVCSVAFSPNGQLIASASGDRTVKLWKTDGTLMTTLSGHHDAVTKVCFSPNGDCIASASGDRTVKLWKTDGTLMTTLSGHHDAVTSLCFSPNGRTLVTASRDKTVKLWSFDLDELMAIAGHWLADYLKLHPDVSHDISMAPPSGNLRSPELESGHGINIAPLRFDSICTQQ